MWSPEGLAASKDFIATTGDYLRLWSVYGDGDVRFERVFNNNKNSEYCAPVTSFDWNTADHSMIGTSSIDTTCTIWDINVGKVKTQLIAHDKEVCDLAWTRDRDMFATVGADGSLRMFDLRSLEHSTIMYETQGGTPLLRLSWNSLDTNYIATFAADTNKAIVLDIRMPALPVAELGGHTAAVNGVVWAPHSACHICTVSDDYQALIWDLSSLPKAVEDPILAYTAEAEISNVAWSASLCDWVNIAFGSRLQVLRV
jgi:WD repeat-containing protein 68